MSRRDPRLALTHMLNHAREAIQLAESTSRKRLDQDRTTNLALMRLLEIVGEAATRVPEEVRAQIPDVPWAEIVALRNRLIHGYDEINLDIVWRILTDDLPHLALDLETALETLEE